MIELYTKQIEDEYVRKNFERIEEAWENLVFTQGDFAFFEVNITGAQNDYKLYHNLGFYPNDIIVTKSIGSNYEFNYAELTDQYITVATDGDLYLRLLIGNLRGNQESGATAFEGIGTGGGGGGDTLKISSNDDVDDYLQAKLISGSSKLTLVVVDEGTNEKLRVDVNEGAISHLNIDDTGSNTHVQIDTHIASTSNPHSVDKTDVGLSNVDNTSDVDKPVSVAQQAEIDTKEDDLGNPLVDGHVLSSTIAGVRSWVAGGSGDKNVDGGAPDSVYLPSQSVDGGGP